MFKKVGNFLFGDTRGADDKQYAINPGDVSAFATDWWDNYTSSLDETADIGDVLSKTSDYANIMTTLDPLRDKGLLGDPHKMGNLAGLASTLMQAAALPSMLKNAQLTNKSLQFNLDTARAEQDRRNRNISAFNQFKA